MKREAERHRDRLAGQLHSLGHEVSLVFARRASTAQVNSTEQNSDPLIHLYARGSAIGVGELTDKGGCTSSTCPRFASTESKLPRGCSADSEYRLPDAHRGKYLMVRLDGNDEDAARKFNRTESAPIDRTTRWVSPGRRG
jgi:hypothetical protein